MTTSKRTATDAARDLNASDPVIALISTTPDYQEVVRLHLARTPRSAARIVIANRLRKARESR